MASSKPSLFIGSSKEHLRLAEAVQTNLAYDFETTIWNQGIFKASQYPLESLAQVLDRSDAGIFVLAPDDLVRMRGKKHLVVRDNVVFELGMFIGKLGRDRSFLLVPQASNAPSLHLPTDLLGLTPVTYEVDRKDKNLIAATGPACNTLRAQIFSMGSGAIRRRNGVERTDFFGEFTERFKQLFDAASHLSVCFIHSRKWRETHNDQIKLFLSRPGAGLTVFLPDLADKALLREIGRGFDDGPHIPGLVADAYRYFSSLKKQFRKTMIDIRLYHHYPTYSVYVFNRETAVMAMYPSSRHRHSVPAFEVDMASEYGQFIATDLIELTRESRSASSVTLSRLIRKTLVAQSTSTRKKRKGRRRGQR